MKAKTLMTRDVACCVPTDSMAQAAYLMWERDCGIVPVVDVEHRVVGTLTDRDICMAALTRGMPLSEISVGEGMAREVHCCHEDEDRHGIHATMRRYQVRRLPVVDADRHLHGVVSLNDLALAAADAPARSSPKLEREVAETLAEIGKHRVPATV